MNDHAEGRVQSEELLHAVYGSICMKFNTKVKLLIVLEAIKIKLLIIDDAHECSSCGSASTVRRPRICHHGKYSQYDMEP